MADKNFEIKRDATLPFYRIQLKSTNPTTGVLEVHDLTNATSILFYMRKTLADPIKVSGGTMSIVGLPTNGVVEYPWVDGDTDTSGRFLVEIKVFVGTRHMKFPSRGWFQVEITDDLVDTD